MTGSVLEPGSTAPSRGPDAVEAAPRRRRALSGALVVGAIGVVFVAVLATRSAAPATLAPSALGGRPAPAIAGSDLRSGAAVRLATLGDHHRRFVLVDFFASWCVPCQQEMPQLAAWAFAHRTRVAVLGVDIADTAANGASFLRRYGATWPAVEDRSGAGSASVAYGVASPPQLFLVAPSGVVVARLVGAPSLAQLDATLAAAVSGRVLR